MINPNRYKNQILSLALTDFLTALCCWIIFFVTRKYVLDPDLGLPSLLDLILSDYKLYTGSILVPLFWNLTFYLSGYYTNPYKKSRLELLGYTFIFTGLGSLVLFFALVLDDVITSYKTYYLALIVLWSIHFIGFSSTRYILVSYYIHQLRLGKFTIPTLLIGTGEPAYQLYQILRQEQDGHQFIGCIQLEEHPSEFLIQEVPCLGKSSDIDAIIQTKKIEEVIVAVENDNYDLLKGLIANLRYYNISVKAPANNHDIMTGAVKNTNLFGEPLVEIYPNIIPQWQKSMKRSFDILSSFIALLILSPIYLITAILVKYSSDGPIFYTQERIGMNGKPFKIIKFRSMYTNAEQHGPKLASDHDPRITPFGRWMRKTRLDEIPQFWNVFKGDMSIVGPRPERQFFIDQIVERAPHYRFLLRIRPGITSWGQVKYGYAENVDQMIQRLRYDILYMENMSFFLDMRILLNTILVVLKKEGK